MIMSDFITELIKLLTEKGFSVGLDMATAISVIGAALTYIFTNIRESRRQEKERKLEADILRKSRIAESGCGILTEEIRSLGQYYNEIINSCNNAIKILSPLLTKSQNDTANKFLYAEIAYNSQKQEELNNSLDDIITNIEINIQKVSKQRYVIFPVLDSITNDAPVEGRLSDQEVIRNELNLFHYNLNSISFELANWKLFWMRLWSLKRQAENVEISIEEVIDYIFFNKDRHKYFILNNFKNFTQKPEFQNYLFKNNVLKNNSERLKKRIKDHIDKSNLNIGLARINGFITKGNIDEVSLFYLMNYPKLIFFEFLQEFSKHINYIIGNIEREFQNSLTLLTSCYYYILNYNESIKLDDIKNKYRNFIIIDKINQIEKSKILQDKLIDKSVKKLSERAMKFKNFIIREIEKPNNNVEKTKKKYYILEQSIMSWNKRCGIKRLSTSLNINIDDAIQLCEDVENKIDSMYIEKKYNINKNIRSPTIRSILVHNLPSSLLNAKEAERFITDITEMIDSNFLSKEEVSQICNISYEQLEAWILHKKDNNDR